MQENKKSQTPEKIIEENRLYGTNFMALSLTSKMELIERDNQEIENCKILGKRNDPEKNLQELKKYFEEERAGYIEYLSLIDVAEYSVNNAAAKYANFHEISKEEAAKSTGVPVNHPDFDGIMHEAAQRNKGKTLPPKNTTIKSCCYNQRTA